MVRMGMRVRARARAKARVSLTMSKVHALSGTAKPCRHCTPT